MPRGKNGSATATNGTVHETGTEATAAPSNITPDRRQRSLIDDGHPIPPRGTITTHDYAVRLVRRTAAHIKALPLDYQRWVIDMLDSEIDQTEADAMAVDDTLGAMSPEAPNPGERAPVGAGAVRDDEPL